MNRLYTIALSSALLLLISCSEDQESGNEPRTRGDHVWKHQVESIDRARDVEGMLKEATDKNKDELEQQLN